MAESNQWDVAIIGGGASGLTAAISAARALGPGRRVGILERMNRVGKKLAATGNGRCNLTNMEAGRSGYHGSGRALAAALFGRYPPEAILAFFEELGVVCKEEEAGRVYPMSDQASSVLDALRLEAGQLGVDEFTEWEASGIIPLKHGFRVTARDGRALACRRVVVAAGGLAAPNLGGSPSGHALLSQLGHRVSPCFPALVQLKTPVDPIRALKGIKFTGEAAILVDGRACRREQGEVLFTEYGLSGPPVMQLSRIASEALSRRRPAAVSVTLYLTPWRYPDALEALTRRRTLLGGRALEHFFTGLVNKRIGQTLLKQAGALPFSRLSESLTGRELQQLAGLLTGWTLPVTGTQGYQQAQVTAGGVLTADFDPHTLESRRAPGVYACGEVLDVDGDCGGYNLQWAWASGLLAGQSCARAILQEKEGGR